MGRTDEALAESRRAIELDPLSTEFNHNVGLTLFRSRRPIRLSRTENAGARSPGLDHHDQSRLGADHSRQVREAVAELEPAGSWMTTTMRSPPRAGLRIEGEEQALGDRRNEGWSKTRYVPPHSVALVYAGSWRKDSPSNGWRKGQRRSEHRLAESRSAGGSAARRQTRRPRPSHRVVSLRPAHRRGGRPAPQSGRLPALSPDPPSHLVGFGDAVLVHREDFPVAHDELPSTIEASMSDADRCGSMRGMRPAGHGGPLCRGR